MKILIDSKTRKQIKSGSLVKTNCSLSGILHGIRPDSNQVLIRTQPDSNTWQASFAPFVIGAEFIEVNQ
jgi:hypothetical protein